MDNPLKKAREAKGLTRRQLALIIGKSYERVASLENGYMTTVPATWREGLEAAGIDYEGLRRDMDAYHAAIMADARKAVL